MIEEKTDKKKTKQWTVEAIRKYVFTFLVYENDDFKEMEMMAEMNNDENNDTTSKNNINNTIDLSDLIGFEMKIGSERIYHIFVHDQDCFAWWNGSYYQIDSEDLAIRQRMVSDIKELPPDNITGLKVSVSHNLIIGLIKDYKMFCVNLFFSRHSEELPNFSFKQNSRIEDIFYINVANGVLKIHDEITLLNSHPGMKFTNSLSINYNPAATCELFLKSFAEIIPIEEDRKYIQIWMAYALINHYWGLQQSIYLYGPRAWNGKTVLCNTLTKIFREIADLDMEGLNESFGLEPLLNADFILGDDISKDSHLDGRVKKLIVGKSQSINTKGVKAIPRCVIDAKLLMNSNHLQEYFRSDPGILRRFKLILAPTNFSKQDNINLELELEDELEGIFNWILEVLPGLPDKINIIKKNIVTDNNEFLIKHGNPLKVFYDRYIIETDNRDDRIFPDELMVCYNKISAFRGHSTIKNITDFGRKIREITNIQSTTIRIGKKKPTIYVEIKIDYPKIIADYPDLFKDRIEMQEIGEKILASEKTQKPEKCEIHKEESCLEKGKTYVNGKPYCTE